MTPEVLSIGTAVFSALLGVIVALVVFIFKTNTDSLKTDIKRLERENESLRGQISATASTVNTHAITLATQATNHANMQADIAETKSAINSMGESLIKAHSKLDVLLGRSGNSPVPFPRKG